MRTLLVLLLLTSPALGAELTAAGDGDVREADFTYEVKLDGVIARVTTRQALRATNGGPVEATYRFELPTGAAITGLAITPPGGKAQRGAAVDAEAAITPAVDRDTVALAPDLGLVRWLGGDRYELVVYPVTADGSTIVELSWVAPMTYIDGRLALRIPDRGDDLGATSGTVTVTPPPGVKKMRDLHASGALVAAKPGKQAWGFVSDGELDFDVTPVLTRAVVTYATAKVGDDGGAVAVSLLRPRADAAPSRFEHVLFVLDLSSSNASAAARDAMTAVVGGVLDGLRDDATVQALVFDHVVHRTFASFAKITAETRAAVTGAIADAAGAQGSDLPRALAEAHGLISRLVGPTLVVIVTDGVLPIDADSAVMEAALDAPADTTISTVLVSPDDLPPPDPRGGSLDELTARHAGHVVATRYGEAAARAKTIANEIASQGDWFLERADADVALPDRVAPGGGFVAFGWYTGAAPGTVTITTTDDELAATETKLARLGALTLAARGVSRADDRGDAAIARTLGVVSAVTSLVAVDRTDELAAARLDLAARGGTFARIPAPVTETFEPPGVEWSEADDIGARYEIDTAGRIRADLLSPQLLPAAHACFDAARLAGAAPSGTVTLEVEIARGEVIASRARSTGAVELIGCLRESAFSLAIPSYTLDDPDAIYLIRYPLQFATKGGVAVGDDTGLDPIDLGDAVDQPLGGLTAED